VRHPHSSPHLKQGQGAAAAHVRWQKAAFSRSASLCRTASIHLNSSRPAIGARPAAGHTGIRIAIAHHTRQMPARSPPSLQGGWAVVAAGHQAHHQGAPAGAFTRPGTRAPTSAWGGPAPGCCLAWKPSPPPSVPSAASTKRTHTSGLGAGAASPSAASPAGRGPSKRLPDATRCFSAHRYHRSWQHPASPMKKTRGKKATRFTWS